METPEDERVEQVGEQIDQARQAAEDANLLIDPEEPKFYKDQYPAVAGTADDVDDEEDEAGGDDLTRAP